MSDKHELSRRGFMGLLAAIGAAPLAVDAAKPFYLGAIEAVPIEPDHTFVEDVIPEPPPDALREGTRLTFQMKRQWLPGGKVLDVYGPSGLTPIPGLMSSGIEFTVAGGTSDVTLLDAMVSGEKVPFRLSFEADPENFWEFHAYVTNWAPTFAEEGNQTVTISLDVAGDPQPCFTIPADS